MKRRGLKSFFAVAAFSASTALASAAVLQPTIVAGVPRGAGMRDLGRAGATVRIDLVFLLKYRNDAELGALIAAQGDEASPLHGNFLTSQQFRDAFSPTPQTYERAIALLKHAGFSVTGTNRSRTALDVSASAPVVERYFNTEIHRIMVDGSAGIRYANARPAILPNELRGTVDGVLGFDTIEWFKPLYRVLPRSIVLPSIPDTKIGQPLRGPDGGFGPLAFVQGYNFPVQHQIAGKPNGTTYDGTGHAAGIAIPADPADSDLTTFLNFYKVKRTGKTTRVPVDGGPHSPSGGAQLEAALDYETIAGAAPGAAVFIYEFNQFTAKEVVDTYDAAVDDNKVDTLNSSFGACETSGFFTPQGIAHAFKQGVAQGQVFHASTGDSGTFTFGCSSTVSVQTPADTPFTTAIGGTALTVDTKGNYVSEQYWNDSTGAGGGGVSKIFPLPSFQKHVKGVTTTGRNIPDVSYDASAITGEDIVFSGTFGVIGGTSLASPLFGACIVEAEQVLGKRVGNLNPALYSHWLKDGYGSGKSLLAHDITTGSAFGILVPQKGYDLATGIGTLDCFNASTKLL
ncbi:MAG: S8 family serine peptidase [Candidatus Eremiobacteraeota bacterium]|nr:S8 family serine peptidase [Candidatus Eremiobacteraeota bacterium]